jgi:hypothetical protein
MSRDRAILAAALLVALAIALFAYEAPDAGRFNAADCFHVAADGTDRLCEGEPQKATPTAAVLAANWAWWGPAAAPITLGLASLALWLRFKRRVAAYSAASPAPPRS